VLEVHAAARAALCDKANEVAPPPGSGMSDVYIVTSSLSKAQVEAVLRGLADGGRPSAHFVPLYWPLGLTTPRALNWAPSASWCFSHSTQSKQRSTNAASAMGGRDDSRLAASPAHLRTDS
jgi:hypothetical protein